MTADESTDSADLVPSQHRELMRRSAALVRRGLDDLSRHLITPDLLYQLKLSLRAQNRDARAEAAHEIMRLAPHLSIREEAVGRLLVELATSLSFMFWYGGDEDYVHSHSGKYESQDVIDLFTSTLHTLLGTEASPGEAILEILERSTGAAKTEAADALTHSHVPKQRALPVLQRALKQATDEWQALTLRFVMAWLSHENADPVYRDMVQYYIASCADYGDDIVLCREYLRRLGLYASPDTAADSFCTLATQGHVDFAASLFYWGFPSSFAASCSQDGWQRMMDIAWSQFLQATARTDLRELSPTRNPTEVRTVLDQAPDRPMYMPDDYYGRLASSLKHTTWGRVLALLMDARIPREAS